jgi:hypothetical protein
MYIATINFWQSMPKKKETTQTKEHKRKKELHWTRTDTKYFNIKCKIYLKLFKKALLVLPIPSPKNKIVYEIIGT